MKVRADILRRYQSVHTWTGILTSLVLFIGFYAGSLTMFKAELSEWAMPAQTQLAQVTQDKLEPLVHHAWQQFPESRSGFVLSFDEHASPLRWYEKGGGRGLRLDDQLRFATLNESCVLVTQAAQQNELGNLIDHLHRTAGIPGELGHEEIGVLVMGVASVLYFLALVSGVVFLLPTLVKSFFALRANKGASRLWLDVHNLIGMLSLPFHIIIAWTVVVFAFHDVFYDGLSQFYGDTPMFERSARSTEVYELASLPPMQHFIDNAAQLAPGYHLREIHFAGLDTANPTAEYRVVKDLQMMRGGDYDVIYTHAFTDAVSYSSVDSDADKPYGPVVKAVFSLHFGNFADIAGKWLYFIMGGLGAVLFYTGNLLWLDKRVRKHKGITPSTSIMARLTLGVCLGSMLAVAVSMVMNGIYTALQWPVNYALLTTYYAVFAMALMYAFMQRIPRAAIHLQVALAVVCTAIALIGLLHWQDDWAIAVTSTVLAIMFARMAQKTRQRGMSGEHSALWSLSAT